MYEVVLINSDEEIILNAVSTNKETPRITGTVVQGINSFDSFTFVIYPNNPGYNRINPYKSKITVYNTKTQEYEFIGRVLTPTGTMEDDGVVYKEYICESELAYLVDSTQRYGEYTDITPENYLKALIAVHNSRIEDDKKFTVGTVEITDINYSTRYTSYNTTWKNIKDDLLDSLGGELRVRYEGDVKYLDYLTEIGETCDTSISLGKNMRNASEQLNIESFYTRIIPLGAKISDGETESEERLTIADVNNGVDYLDYEDGINQYGIIQGIVTWDDVTTAEALKSKTQAYIEAMELSLSNQINAYDLSLLGLDVDSFKVGNYYPIKNELLDINYSLRIIKKQIKIDEPSENTITFGDKYLDIKELNALKEKNTNDKIASLEKKITKVNNNIGVVAGKRIEAYDEVLNQTALFDKLTEGGYDGLYLDDDGNLFIKANYIGLGILASIAKVVGGTEPVSWLNMDSGAFSFGGGRLFYDIDNGLKVIGDIIANSLALGDGVTIPYSNLEDTPDLDIYIAKDGTVGSTPSEGTTGFKVSKAGLLEAANAVIYGTIYASEGAIAGYNIGSGGSYSNAIYKRVSGDSADYEVGMKATSGDTDLAFFVKKSTDDWESSVNTFYIRNNGALYCRENFTIGSIDDGTVAEHKQSYSKWTHADGSYSKAGTDGFERYISGSGNKYHSLFYVKWLSFDVSSASEEKYYTLPEEFQDTDPYLFAVIESVTVPYGHTLYQFGASAGMNDADARQVFVNAWVSGYEGTSLKYEGSVGVYVVAMA